MNSNIWFTGLSGLVHPLLIPYIRYLSNQWCEGKKIVSSSQFDTVNEDKHQRVFNELLQMNDEKTVNNTLSGLKHRALYRIIGLPYSDEVCGNILSYVFHHDISFNDPALNCFLRTPELTSMENGFQQVHSKRQRRRWLTLISGAVMLVAIYYGYMSTVPVFLSQKGWLYIIFPIGSVLYLGVLLFVVRFIIESLRGVEMSKKFW